MSLIDSLGAGAQIGSSAMSTVGLGAALLKPKNPPPGIDGILFDIPLNETVNYSAQITDHFTEINSAIQDHAALEPLKITLTGKISELVYTKYEAMAFLSAVSSVLASIDVLSPSNALAVQRAIASAAAAAQAAKVLLAGYKTLSAIFSGEPMQNNQQEIFSKFEKMFLSRTIMTVETPWKTYDSMIIESWTADQGEDSMLETTFTLNFKQLRFIGTETNTGQLNGRIAQQASPVTQTGDTGGGASALINLGVGSFIPK